MATKKNEAVKKAPVNKPAKKEVKHITPELILAVIKGEWGSPETRNIKLTAAGYNPSAVTKKINDLKKMVPEVQSVKDKADDYFVCLLSLLK